MNDNEQRDELATDIMNAFYEASDGSGSRYWGEMANFLAATGYRKPRTITTVEELGALFEGAFGTDADGLLWKIDGGTCAWINIDEGQDEKYRDDEIKLPFTLLSPEAEATR